MYVVYGVNNEDRYYDFIVGRYTNKKEAIFVYDTFDTEEEAKKKAKTEQKWCNFYDEEDIDYIVMTYEKAVAELKHRRAFED